MTSKAPLNGLLIVGGVVAAAAIWAGAFLLPSPAPRQPALTASGPDTTLVLAASQPAPEAPAPEPQVEPVAAPAAVAQDPAPALVAVASAPIDKAAFGSLQVSMEPPAPEAPAPEPQVEPVAAPTTVAQDPAPEPVAVASAPVDTAAFGSLQLSMEPPALPQRVSMLDAAGSVPLTSISFASTPLQSIGATFAEPVAGMGLPEFGGASALDGPADSGLDSPVTRSDEADAHGPSVSPPRGKIIAIDASEGTKIDPLRQRNWDLNAVQVIPPMPSPTPTPTPIQSNAPPRR